MRASAAQVLLVGGATRMPAVRELVRRITGREPCSEAELDPDTAVAQGAAVQAAALGGVIRRDAAILLDETPDCQDFAALLEQMEERTGRRSTH